MTSPGTGRRSFLRGLLGVGAAAATTGYAVHDAQAAAAAPATGNAPDAEAALAAVPFHGVHQAGILPSPQRQALVVAFDLPAGNRAELADMLQALTSRARFLTAGGPPPPTGLTGP